MACVLLLASAWEVFDEPIVVPTSPEAIGVEHVDEYGYAPTVVGL